MKYKIKLNKDYTAPDGVVHKAGKPVETDDDGIASKLLLDGAEHWSPDKEAAMQAAIDAKIVADREATVKEVMKALGDRKVSFGDQLTVTQSEEDKIIKTGGFADVGEFLFHVTKFYTGGTGRDKMDRYISTAQKAMNALPQDVRQKAPQGMNVAEDSSGGILVPPQYADLWRTEMLEESIVAPLATHVQMTAQEINIPALVDDSHASTFYGGVQVYWGSEGESTTATKPALRMIQLRQHPLIGVVYASDLLLKFSSPTVTSIINTVFPQVMGWTLDEAYLFGDGADKPVGALSGHPARVSVAAEPAQTATTVWFQNIVNMEARLWITGMNASKVCWIANQTVKPQLATMSMAVGTGGVPVFLPANGAAGRPYQELYGYPIKYTEKAATLGTQTDINLCDCGRYLIGDLVGAGIEQAASIHVRFLQSETAYRFTTYTAGGPWMRTTFQPKNGNVLSGYVTLDSRT